MADYQLSVELSAKIDGLRDGFNAAIRQTSTFDKTTRERLKSIDKGFSDLADDIDKSLNAKAVGSVNKASKSISNALNEVNSDTEETGKSFKKLEKSIKSNTDLADSFSSKIAGMFSVAAVGSFVKSVIEATSEYEKLDAVLGNTLGSSALANLKLKELQDFAAKTPFGVNELTAAYVKLANSGFKPSGEEMVKLGDLASSTGKSFDQLAEAIIDAQTGEFERLKEFGIRAKDAGDKVTFTYKGVQTQVDKTSGSIRDYITSLGDAEGTSGAMAKISETLGGKISNLGDSWDQMLIAVGKNTSGVFSGAINIMDMSINKVTEFNDKLEIASKYKIGNSFTRGFQGLAEMVSPQPIGPSLDDVKVGVIRQTIADVNKFVSTAISGAKSANDFGRSLAALKIIGDRELKNLKDPKLIKGVSDAYQNGVKAIQDSRTNFNKSINAKDSNFGTTKGGIKSVSDVLKELDEDLRKTGNQFQSTFESRSLDKIKNYQSAIDKLSKSTGVDALNAIKALREEQQRSYLLGPNKSLSGSVNQGLPAQRNSLGQVGLLGIGEGGQMKDDSLNRYKKQLADKAALITDNQKFILENSKDFNKKFSALTNLSMISEGLSMAFNDIGSSLAAGASIFEAAGEGLQKAFGSIISALGQQFIQLGVAKIAAAALLTPFGAAMAAQGAGLVALGAGLSIAGGFASSMGRQNSNSGSPVTAFADGGIISGPTLGLMGEYAGAKSDPEVVAPLSKLKDLIGFDTPNGAGSSAKQQIVVLDHTISLTGQQLDIIIKRYNATR